MTQQTMRAIRYHQFGGADMLKLEQVQLPSPQSEEVLIRVYAAGVLPIDWKIRQGLVKFPIKLPLIPGTSFSGIIEEVGSNIATFQKGQAVVGRSTTGTYAEYTVASIDSIARIPQSISFEEAATIPGGAATAWQALIHDGELTAGKRVLIHGAAGGVGLFAVQFAKWKGAYVIGTGSASNLDFIRSLGADEVIDYTSTPFEQVTQDVDLVLDTVGGKTLERSLSVLNNKGIIVTLVGYPPFNQLDPSGKKIFRPSRISSSEDLIEIVKLIDSQNVKAEVATTIPLHEAQRAHELSQHGHGRGRIVLSILHEEGH